jgi:hypothetical protein
LVLLRSFLHGHHRGVATCAEFLLKRHGFASRHRACVEFLLNPASGGQTQVEVRACVGRELRLMICALLRLHLEERHRIVCPRLISLSHNSQSEKAKHLIGL